MTVTTFEFAAELSLTIPGLTDPADYPSSGKYRKTFHLPFHPRPGDRLADGTGLEYEVAEDQPTFHLDKERFTGRVEVMSWGDTQIQELSDKAKALKSAGWSKAN